MKVKALMEGYYSNRRVFEGQVFEIKGEAEFSSKWMEKHEKAKKVSKARSKVKEVSEETASNEEVI